MDHEYLDPFEANSADACIDSDGTGKAFLNPIRNRRLSERQVKIKSQDEAPVEQSKPEQSENTITCHKRLLGKIHNEDPNLGAFLWYGND